MPSKNVVPIGVPLETLFLYTIAGSQVTFPSIAVCGIHSVLLMCCVLFLCVCVVLQCIDLFLCVYCVLKMEVSIYFCILLLFG